MYVVSLSSGELMRFATNSVTSGDRAIVATICTFLRNVYATYQKLSSKINQSGPYKELPKKMEVWLQSLMKIEALCYKLHIRGAEIKDARMLNQLLMQDMNGGGEREFGEREGGGAEE